MDKQAAIKWLKTALLASGGGGVAGAFAAAMDPSRYRFPHDFGSGKLWEYFAEGAAVTFAALLFKSPLGQQAMGAYKESQEQLEKDRQAMADMKVHFKGAELKGGADDAGKAGTKTQAGSEEKGLQ